MNIHGCKAATNTNRIPFLIIDSNNKAKVIFNKFTPRYKSDDWVNGTNDNMLRPIICLDITSTNTLEADIFTANVIG